MRYPLLWFLLSLLTAIFVATSDALSKLALRDCNAETVAWVRWAFALPFLLCFLPFIDIPQLDWQFWVIVFFAIPLEITAIILYMQAIKVSPLSLTIPFLALTPVFLILASFFLLGELPDESGIAGILLIAGGAYLLNIEKFREGIWAPLKVIKNEKGSLLIIVVAFIYSITASLGKMAILHSSPLFFAIFYTFLLTLFLAPFVWLRRKKEKQGVKVKPLLFVMIGLTYALMLICHFWAVSLIEVAYMISIKRTSMLFSVFYGWLLFREENIRQRLAGSTIMATGVALILL